MQRLLAVCLGGALGSGARYLVGLWAAARFGKQLPYGTFGVNLLGSFLLALLLSYLGDARVSDTTKLALTTGMMGGFTTYSTFSYEALQMWQQQGPRRALGYVAATLTLCLLGSLLGVAAGLRLNTLIGTT